ncbi:MAG TPA: porin family protein [Herbaspirillum sp.]|uniref:porin family protein n=1 Tax=Herbaspirillum sp. TaxID=1890675 RepID=UPI002D3A03A2|nr:porin family protein [Herbaspirillum sp.]HZG22316.1 porin family protein [Herbaspirillum sp.]
MKKMHLLAVGMLLTASSVSTWAQAVKSDRGVYIGFEGGIGSYHIGGEDASSSENYTDSRNASALRALIGYRFSPNFSVEAGYLSLGSYKRELIHGNHRWNLKADTDAFDLSIVYKFTQFVPGLYVKGGLMNSKVSIQTVGEGPGRNRSTRDSSRSGNGYLLGLGYEYDLTPNWSANAGFTRLQRIGGSWEDGVSVDANLYSAGLKYRF